MKVGVWLKKANITYSIDEIEKGNPGIGGTLFEIAFVSLLLKKTYPELDISIFTNDKNLNSSIIPIIYINNELEIFDDKYKSDVDIVLFAQNEVNNDLYLKLSTSFVRAIVWVHNFLTLNEYRQIMDCENIKRVVFVGQQHYDYYVDDPIIYKSTFIYNCMPYTEILKRDNNLKGVLYNGALIEQKGFGVLAKAWKQIIKSIPDAHLYVFGGGMYGKENKKFTDYYMSFLKENDGSIMKSVSFEGTVRQDKEKYYKKISVGVANPSGKTETFCLSAVEFELQGIPVVTYDGLGLLDTVEDNYTGLRVKGSRKLAKSIIFLLDNMDKNIEIGKNGHIFASENFYPNLIIPCWYNLFYDIYNDIPAKFLFSKYNLKYNFKWLKFTNYLLQTKVFKKNKISIQYIHLNVKQGIKKILSKKRKGCHYDS